MTPSRSRRPQRDFAPRPRARYVPFTPPEGEPDGPEAVRRHLRWLLANMDWFAAQGRGPLASASVALHRDLAALSAPYGESMAGATGNNEWGKTAAVAELQARAQELEQACRSKQQAVERLDSRLGEAKYWAQKLCDGLLACLPPESARDEMQAQIHNLICAYGERILKS